MRGLKDGGKSPMNRPEHKTYTDEILTQEADKYRHEREDRPGRDEREVIATPAVSCVE